MLARGRCILGCFLVVLYQVLLVNVIFETKRLKIVSVESMRGSPLRRYTIGKV